MSESESESDTRTLGDGVEARRSPSPGSAMDEDEGFEPSTEVVAAFDELMASRLDVGALTAEVAGDGEGAKDEGEGNLEAVLASEPDPASMSKAERVKAAKKRRKERDRAAKAAAAAALAAVTAAAPKPEDEVVPFRLFDAVAPVSLSTEEWYPLPSNPRLTPLPADVRARIARIAHEAAVDPATLARLPGSSSTDGAASAADTWTADTDVPLPPAFLAYTADGDTPCIALPSVQLYQSQEDEQRPKRKRRRAREFPPPQFWHPPPGVVSREYGRGWAV